MVLILHKFESYCLAEVITSASVVPPALSATFTNFYANVIMISLVASFGCRKRLSQSSRKDFLISLSILERLG